MKDFLKILGIICLGTLIIIIALPLIIILSPFEYFRRKEFKKRYAVFLQENNGKNFFCYNNRKKSNLFIEANILPELPDQIEIVYLDGKKIISEYPVEFISNALYSLKFYRKFPHLMKIRNGELIDQSINNSFYSVLNQQKDKSLLLNQINDFFEISPMEK